VDVEGGNSVVNASIDDVHVVTMTSNKKLLPADFNLKVGIPNSNDGQDAQAWVDSVKLQEWP